MSTKSLIVGGLGQVGNQIAQYLGQPNVLRTSRQPAEPDQLRVDLAEFARNPRLAYDLIEQHTPKAIYCTGGMTHVDRCESEPEAALLTNCLGPATLAKAAAAFRVPFVYFSTDYVFDGRSGPYLENDSPNPLSVYGASKWRGELATQDAHPNSLVVRTTVVYGPDPAERNFVYQCLRAWNEGRQMRIPDDQFSSPTYNEDLARATIQLVEAGASGVFHVAGPQTMSRFEFARTIARQLKVDDSLITGISTADLAQQAKRPLRAGLLSGKLQGMLPEVRMQSVENTISAWLKRDVVGAV